MMSRGSRVPRARRGNPIMATPKRATGPAGAATRFVPLARRVGLVAVLAILLTALAAVTATPRSALGHAYVGSSQPAAGSVVETPPAQVTMTFTEALEPSGSRAALYDQRGVEVPGTSYTIPGRHDMTLALPGGLAQGTYAVVWTSLSGDDGHAASGYFSFTIGDESDIATVVLPPLAGTAGPAATLTTIARSVTYLGLAVLVGIWPIWLLVVRPALRPVWQLGPDAVRRARLLVAVGLGLALGGSVMALILQASTVGDGWLDGLRTTLTGTRWGRLWWVRVGLLVAVGAVLLGVAPWWFPRRRWTFALALAGLAAAPVVPFSLIAHAAAQPEGRAAAVATDVTHAVAASLWLGGVALLACVLLPALRGLSAAGRRVVLLGAIPRFSVVALSAWAALALSGFYASWLQVGNLTALVDTGYGITLIVKLAVIVAVLALAAFNLVILTRRLRRVTTDREADRWSRLFRTLIVAELVLGIAVLGVTGRLTGSEPAREVLDQRSGQIIVPLTLGDRQGTLGMAPGASGLNHFQVQLSGAALPEASEVLLRLGLPATLTETSDLKLERIASDTWEWHGSEIAVPGDWSVAVIVRQAGVSDLSQRLTIPIATTPPDVGAPGEPPRFTSVGISALILIVMGVTGLVVAVAMARSPSRREVGGLAGVGLAVGIVMLLQAQVDPALSAVPDNPVVADAAAIRLGETLWTQNCLSCHGALGQGDGPAAAALDDPPPDLTTTHERYHSEQQYFLSISEGVEGTAMPAFGDTLSDLDIWHLVIYVRYLQGGGTSTGPSTGGAPHGIVDGTTKSTDDAAESLACLVGPATPAGLTATDPDPAVTVSPTATPDRAVACDAAVRPAGVGTASVPADWAGLPVGTGPGAMPPAGVPPGAGGGA